MLKTKEVYNAQIKTKSWLSYFYLYSEQNNWMATFPSHYLHSFVNLKIQYWFKMVETNTVM